MASSELISQCVVINGLPNSYREKDVFGMICRHLNEGQTVINNVGELGLPGTPSRWFIQLNSKQAIQKLCNELKLEELYLKGGQRVLINYERPQPSEIPKNWKYVQEKMYPQLTQNVTGSHDNAMFSPNNNNFPMYNPSGAGMFPNPGQPIYGNTNSSYGLGYSSAEAPSGPLPSPVRNQALQTQQHYSTSLSNQFPQAMTSPRQAYHDNQFPNVAPHFQQANPGIRFSSPMSYQGEMNTDNQFSSQTIYQNQTASDSRLTSSVPYQGQTYQINPNLPMPQFQGNQVNQFTPVTPFKGQTNPAHHFPATPQIPGQFNQGQVYPLPINPGNQLGNMLGQGPGPVFPMFQQPPYFPQLPVNANQSYNQGLWHNQYPGNIPMQASGQNLPLIQGTEYGMFEKQLKDKGHENVDDVRILEEDKRNESIIDHKVRRESSGTMRHGTQQIKETPSKESEERSTDMKTEEDKQTSIRVDGVKDILSKDNLELYFESPRVGGGDIENVWFDCLDDDVMFIQFKEASVAKSVLARRHIYKNLELNVSSCASIQYYDNKVLIDGLKQTTTEDCLCDFLAVKADCEANDFLFSRSENTCKVLVTMDQSLDIPKLEKACLKHKLEGATLRVSRVPVSNCLLVTSLTPDINEETIQLYFENHRKSGGGPVEKVKLNEDKTSCLVYFQNFKDIDDVIKKKQHILNNVRLTVEHFQPCLGLPECFTMKKKIQIPSNFTLKKISKHVITLLRSSKSILNEFEERLRNYKALPCIPSGEDEIKISYMGEDPSHDELELIENWEQNISEICSKFIDGIVVNETKVPNHNWQKVTQSLQEINIGNPDLVIVKLDKNARIIIVAGYRYIAGPIIQQIETMNEQKLTTPDVQEKTSKDTVTALKPIENRMLDLVGFRQDMNKMNSALKVSFEDDYKGITFEGNDADINEAKLKMYEARNSIGIVNEKVSDPLLLHLYKSKQTERYISNVLKEKRLICLFEVTSDAVIVYSGDKTVTDKCVHVIRRAVSQHSVLVNKEAKRYLETRLCKQKIENLQRANEGKLLIECNVNDCCIEIYALENIKEDIVDEIEDDLSKNMSLQKKINCSVNEATFIEKYKKASLIDIEQKLQEYHVKITLKQNVFIAQGPEEGISKAMEQVQGLIKSIKKRNHTFKRTRFALSITSKMGRERLSTIEKDLSCLIATKGGSDDRPVNPQSSSSIRQTLNANATCRINDKLEIQTVKCDITEVDVSMIVNSTDEKISMSHGLGKVLANKGGREVKKACCDFIAKYGKLEECEVLVSPAGNLNPDYILHLSVPKWQHGHGSDDNLFTAILNCLHKAEDHQAVSIAIPAIGCGAARYPVGTATDIIVAAIKKFYSSKQRRAVTKVILCDMRADNVDEFTRALTNHFGKYKVKVMKRDETRSERNLYERKPDTKHKEHNRRRRGSENVDKVLLGNITVSVVKGSVAKQKCDAIVNIVDKTLDLKRGTISATLLSTGGDELQQELKTKYPNGLEYGQIAVTSGKKLTCQFLIHARLGPWSGANKDSSKESLQTFLNMCLRGADQQKVSTVVFPAVGTGKLGYPKEVAAKEMFTTISQFSKDNQQSTIKEIRIVIYQEDIPTVEAFENESSFWETGERHNPRDLRSVYLDADNERRSAKDGERNGGKRYQLGVLKITVKNGNILDDDSDCIVMSIPKSLDLEKGAVSKEMYKRCGDDVKSELERKKDWFRKSELVTTSAPNLDCKGLIHVATQDKTDGWQSVVEKALKKAEEKHWKSIAFPALGTSYRIKPAAIAECMVAAFIRFEKTKPRNVSDIRLVIYQRDMLHVFHDALSSAHLQGGPEAHRHMLKNSSDPDSITFTILATEHGVIERAVSKIEECYDQKDFNDEIIKTFTRYHKDHLKEIESQENVAITFDKDKGTIQISRLKENVLKASDKVHSILREALKFEKNKTSADMTSVMVQWFYTDTGSSQLVPYDKAINFKIEKAFKANDTTVSFKDSKQEMFTIDLKQMKGHPVKNTADVTTVVRKDLVKAGSANIPSTWAPMTGNLSVVPLANTDPEYITTKNTFIASIGNVNVVKIERVQNKALWQQYQAKKQQMEQSNPPNTKNETLLWHGSSSVGIDNIKAHGFDRSYSNMGCSIGVGVYFSPHASVSHGYARADATGVKRMFHCRVLTGEYTQGQHAIRYPPAKPSGGPNAKYDSVVNNMAGPTEFVIFNDTQAYPEYLISFQ